LGPEDLPQMEWRLSCSTLIKLWKNDTHISIRTIIRVHVCICIFCIFCIFCILCSQKWLLVDFWNIWSFFPKNYGHADLAVPVPAAGRAATAAFSRRRNLLRWWTQSDMTMTIWGRFYKTVSTVIYRLNIIWSKLFLASYFKDR
jgi:hypothetical protein